MTMTLNPHQQQSQPQQYQPQQYQPQQYQPQQYQPQRDRSTATPLESEQRRSVNRGALLAGLLIIIAAVIGFGSDVAATGPSVGAPEVPVTADIAGSDAITLYIVQPGDTLWDIASVIALPGEDIRPLVDELQGISGGAALEVGQRLVIDHTMIRR